MVVVFLWLGLGSFVYFIDPGAFMAVVVFFILIFTALFFTFSTILAHTRRGLITSLGLTLFLILRYFGIGHILNFLLLLAVCLCVEIYFNRLN